MVQNKEHRPAETFADRMRQSGVLDLLEEYMDIRDELEEASVLQDIAHMPARVKCAVLGWHTMQELLKTEEK